MRNEASERPFPNNMFYDLKAEPPKEQAEDFYASLMYVLRVITDARNSRAFLLRYKEGKTYDEIGEALNISKQRAQILLQDILDLFTGEHVAMLRYGIKNYYERLLNDRINYLSETIEDSDREEVMKEYYEKGYEKGFADGTVGRETERANSDLLSMIRIDTLPLSVRTYNALRKNGIVTLGDIVMVGDKVIDFTSFGKTCFAEIAKVLEDYHVNIKTTFPKACIKFAV